jgi:hypothetical protein
VRPGHGPGEQGPLRPPAAIGDAPEHAIVILTAVALYIDGVRLYPVTLVGRRADLDRLLVASGRIRVVPARPAYGNAFQIPLRDQAQLVRENYRRVLVDVTHRHDLERLVEVVASNGGGGGGGGDPPKGRGSSAGGTGPIHRSPAGECKLDSEVCFDVQTGLSSVTISCGSVELSLSAEGQLSIDMKVVETRRLGHRR